MFVKTPSAASYLVSEANGTRSRDVVTIAKGVHALPGTVLGKVTATGHYVPLAPTKGSGEDETPDGSQTAAAVLFAEVEARRDKCRNQSEINGALLCFIL